MVASQSRHWAAAWPWVRTDATSPRLVPGRTYNPNSTGMTTSPVIISGSPSTSLSRVADTPPSTEFSMGTTAPVTWLCRTASRASPTLEKATPSASVMLSIAWCVNVPAGPKYPSTVTG